MCVSHVRQVWFHMINAMHLPARVAPTIKPVFPAWNWNPQRHRACC